MAKKKDYEIAPTMSNQEAAFSILETKGPLTRPQVHEHYKDVLTLKQIDCALKDLCALSRISVRDGVYSVSTGYKLAALVTSQLWNRDLRINHG